MLESPAAARHVRPSLLAPTLVGAMLHRRCVTKVVPGACQHFQAVKSRPPCRSSITAQLPPGLHLLAQPPHTATAPLALQDGAPMQQQEQLTALVAAPCRVFSRPQHRMHRQCCQSHDVLASKGTSVMTATRVATPQAGLKRLATADGVAWMPLQPAREALLRCAAGVDAPVCGLALLATHAGRTVAALPSLCSQLNVLQGLSAGTASVLSELRYERCAKCPASHSLRCHLAEAQPLGCCLVPPEQRILGTNAAAVAV
ncbi:hypothetical protein COO60DRAFT_1489806 [Scenedesmus sp. NREL 46B-D3]|nr:hypothetical protein COO60DRAFT_1489806 [Scenedesmus sp. NREL 46B-D3]